MPKPELKRDLQGRFVSLPVANRSATAIKLGLIDTVLHEDTTDDAEMGVLREDETATNRFDLSTKQLELAVEWFSLCAELDRRSKNNEWLWDQEITLRSETIVKQMAVCMKQLSGVVTMKNDFGKYMIAAQNQMNDWWNDGLIRICLEDELMTRHADLIKQEICYEVPGTRQPC